MPKKRATARAAPPRGACPAEQRMPVAAKLVEGCRQLQVIDGGRIVVCLPVLVVDPSRLD